MARLRAVLIASALIGLCNGQCFSASDVSAGVILPVVLFAAITAAVLIFLWKTRRIVFCPGRNHGKRAEGNGATGHRIQSDHSKAYTNPGFEDDSQLPSEVAMEAGLGGFETGDHGDENRSPSGKKSPKKGGQKTSTAKLQQSSPQKSSLAKTRDLSPFENLTRKRSTTSLDATLLNTNPEVVSVCLQSQDFIGLGFNIQGSMRDGIWVSQVHNRGPANESGKITAGDRIQSVTISFEKMVYEDALTILSYASPYPVKINLQKNGAFVGDRKSFVETDNPLNHPIYRSQSLDALTGIGKEPMLRKKRAFSEMKSDINKNSHTKIHTVKLATCQEPEAKPSEDRMRWSTFNLPEFPDIKISEEADQLFADAKKKAEKEELDLKMKSDVVDASPGQVNLDISTDKTDTSMFDVTHLSDMSYPSDTLEDVSVSLNETPWKTKVEETELSDRAKAALDFDAMFNNFASTDKDDSGISNDAGSKTTDHKDVKGVDLFDVNFELESDSDRNVSGTFPDDLVQMKESVVSEAGVRLENTKLDLNQGKQDIVEEIIPVVKSKNLNAALRFDDDENAGESMQEDEIVPEIQERKVEFDTKTEIELMDVEASGGVEEEVDVDVIKENFRNAMMDDSASVEASVLRMDRQDTEAVEEDTIEAVTVIRGADNDKTYGASLRDAEPLLLQDDVEVPEPVAVDDIIQAEVITPDFVSPFHTTAPVRRKKRGLSESSEEISSAEEGEYRVQQDSSVRRVFHEVELQPEINVLQDVDDDKAELVEVTSGELTLAELRTLQAQMMTSRSSDLHVKKVFNDVKSQPEVDDNDKAELVKVIGGELTTAELRKLETQMMASRAYHIEASSGNAMKTMRSGESEDSEDLHLPPMTRAVSYDQRISTQAQTVSEGRSGSFKEDKHGKVTESSPLDWSGKRLVRSGSFNKIPTDEDPEDQRDWRFNNNLDLPIDGGELKKYKNLEDLRGSDSSLEDQSSGLIKTEIYSARDNLTNLSGSNSHASSRASTPGEITANGADDNLITSQETVHTVTKSYMVTTDRDLHSVGPGAYTVTVRTGSEGEESDSMA